MIARGQRNGAAKLSEQNVRDIRDLRSKGQSYSFIAMLFNVNHSTIWRIINGEHWTHVK